MGKKKSIEKKKSVEKKKEEAKEEEPEKPDIPRGNRDLNPVVRCQAWVRGWVQRRKTKRMRLAREAGVMVACTGTTQGQSGWYMDFDGEVYYFAVDMYETWWQLVKQEDFDKNKKQFEVDDTPVLVADPLTRIGYPGFYREHHRPEGTGPKERVKAAASVYW